MHLVLDIETIANEQMTPFLPEPQAPSNYRDPAKIERYIAEKRAALAEGMPLDIDFARVCALGYAEGLEEEPTVILAHNDGEERALLETFWNLVAALDTTIVGYNVLGFDLPILLRRSWTLSVQPSRPLDLRRYNPSGVVDLMQLLYHWGYAPGTKWRGLKDVARMYGIPNEYPDLDGSQVAEMDDETLRLYCANDVRMIQALARRTRGWYW